MKSKYIALDTETTGLDPTIHQCLSIGAIVLDKDLNEIDRFYTEIQYTVYHVSPYALTVNKFDLSKFKDNPTHAGAVRLFQKFLDKYAGLHHSHKLIPIAQNWPFDKGFLQVVMGPLFNDYFDYHFIDTCVIAEFAKLINIELPESTSLQSLVKYFNLKLEGEAHNAMTDAAACVEVLKQFKDMIRENQLPDVEQDDD